MSGSTTPTFRWLIVSAVVIPTIMFLFSIRQDYERTLSTNEIELVRTSAIFKQHAMNVFETHQLIAERIDEHLKGKSWEEISRDGTIHPFLRAIVREYPQVQGIWLADADGRVRNASELLPPTPVSVADRDYYLGLKGGASGPFIGNVVKPKVMRDLNFNIAWRHGSTGGRFDGVIVVTAFPRYFNDFWSKATVRKESAVALVRGDGAVLARLPSLDPQRLTLPPDSLQMRAMRSADHGTFGSTAYNDRVERFYAFHKLDKHDVYVLYGINRDAVLAGWHRHVQYYGGFFGLALAVLLWFSLAASRYAAKEQAVGQALQESEERLRLLGDNLPDSAVYQYLRDRDGRRSFQYFSKGVERLNGVTVEQVLDDAGTLHRQILPEYYPLMEQAEAESARDLSDFAAEVPMRLADGSLRWMQLHSRPRRLSGGVVVWDGVQTDVTARRRTEEALRRLNEELDSRVTERTLELRQKDQVMAQQSRLAAMGEMIQNIAHQWRQPLNTLGLTVQRLQVMYDVGQFNKDFLDRSVEDAMLIIQHMSKTIDDFRDFFKPNKERERFEVSRAIDRSLELIKATFDNNHIGIRFDLQGDHTVTGYPNEYSQVILNILSNAKDALVASQVGEPLVVITAREEGGRSIVTVSDNAGGIPEEVLPKIFDPHFTTKGPQGTGIGLFMAKTIIERSMNGELAVRNTDCGAEFRIVV